MRIRLDHRSIILIIDAVGEWIVYAETNLQTERKIGLNGAFANGINNPGKARRGILLGRL
jgi:hypothetical protein